MGKRIIVIGGGMAGTSAAYFLTKRGYDVTIIEKEDRLGGRMKSEIVDNVALEYGAGFVMDVYSNVLRFLSEHGLKDQLHPYSALPGIQRDEKIRTLGVRTILGTSMLSWGAKLRGLRFLAKVLWHWRSIDVHQPWKLARFDNVSVGAFCATPHGKELFDYFLQSSLSATFYWTPEEVKNTSQAILFIAAKSILIGGPYKMRDGLQRIPEKAAEGSTMLLGYTVTRVERESKGTYSVTAMHDSNERTLTADGIVCATTATVALDIFSDLTAGQRAFLESMDYSSVAYAGSIYREEDLQDNRSIAIPSIEGSRISAITSMIGPRVDASEPLTGSVKTSAAGDAGKELHGQPEHAILKALTKGSRPAHELVFSGSPTPLSTRTWYWDEALPIFRTGYFKRLGRFLEEETASGRPLVFAGDYIGGAFVEGAFTSGMQAAKRLEAVLARAGEG